MATMVDMAPARLLRYLASNSSAALTLRSGEREPRVHPCGCAAAGLLTPAKLPQCNSCRATEVARPESQGVETDS